MRWDNPESDIRFYLCGMRSIVEELKVTCLNKLKENQHKIHESIDRLSEEDLWWRPNAQSNSIGNIVLHLCGNLTQYILSGIGGAEDHRKRSSEFAEQGPIAKNEILSRLDQTLEKAYEVIHQCDEPSLMTDRQVQVYDVSGVNILIHVTEHFSYHTGQIAYFTKWRSGKSLNFYDDKKLEGTSHK